jgi:hypothetical protein
MAKKTKRSSPKVKKAKPGPNRKGGRGASGKGKQSKVRKLIALAKKMLRRK